MFCGIIVSLLKIFIETGSTEVAIYDKKRIHETILKCAKLYEQNLNGKNFLYIIQGKNQKPFELEVLYTATGFSHLMGVDSH